VDSVLILIETTHHGWYVFIHLNVLYVFIQLYILYIVEIFLKTGH